MDVEINIDYYNPNNKQYVYLNRIFNNLNLHRYVGWKMFVKSNKWNFDIEEIVDDIRNVPYIGHGIKIFRNHSIDMNYWKTSKEHAEEIIRRYKILNPYIKASIEKINKKVIEIDKINKQEKAMRERQSISHHIGNRVSFTGEIMALQIITKEDIERQVIVPYAQITIGDIVTEYGEYIDHINVFYKKDAFIKYCKLITIGSRVQCVGTVCKYNYENKYSITDVIINVVS